MAEGTRRSLNRSAAEDCGTRERCERMQHNEVRELSEILGGIVRCEMLDTVYVKETTSVRERHRDYERRPRGVRESYDMQQRVAATRGAREASWRRPRGF